MDDLIRRSDVLSKVYYSPARVVDAIEIETAPAVDAVEVVRCRECVHRQKYVCDKLEFFECDHIGMGTTRVGVTDNWYCADGKHREEEHNAVN